MPIEDLRERLAIDNKAETFPVTPKIYGWALFTVI
jgi:hypothetical protein